MVKQRTTEQLAHANALEKIKRRKPGTGTVDSTAPRCMEMAHLRLRLKKHQIAETRSMEIERDNRRLLRKMASIITSPGSAVLPRPLRRRRRLDERIAAQNELNAQRLRDIKPYYDQQVWTKERQVQEQIIKRLAKMPAPLFDTPEEVAPLLVVEKPRSAPVAPPQTRQIRRRKKPPRTAEAPPEHTPLAPEEPPPKETTKLAPQQRRSKPPKPVFVNKPRPASPEMPRTTTRYPVRPPDNGVRADESSRDTDAMNRAFSHATHEFTLFERRVGIEADARVVAPGAVELAVAATLDDRRNEATLVARMPALALVDPDATTNFVHALATRVLRAAAARFEADTASRDHRMIPLDDIQRDTLLSMLHMILRHD
ncbi:hypothetical protein CTAYLR_001662 [Chrysophaeum taylorii]|uniref:Uncharacterized protein n=1 Tax=Chrysophaeum taylorii TaxID=2483200 RepID=A0AAD7XNA0_9STRA|nr:hypothetical protein CTAYLR_001662 [Chrysophaeum taylorii]